MARGDGREHSRWYCETLDLMKKHEIGWCFWPWKKVWTDNCPRPTPDEAAAAVRAMLQAASVSRCRRNAEVIRILASS